ncbi:MAG: LLM class flavin-dependent oxidoreductase, partial [Xanthomonadaceae bacterium]|nr:LLM class flavin-dependent oxidoreductase [Xanthomonadaceae bacterium]
MLPFSFLDLVPICEGSNVAQAFRNTRDMAVRAEQLGYRRYWLAEHHNMPGIASTSTSVLIGYIASSTKYIRVGAGGIMLPNHTPLQVAETFGTLTNLYPGRIDLGLGRAPGTDHATTRALRRYFDSAEQYPQDVSEVLNYFEPVRSGQAVQAVPAAGIDVPVWILGSSLFGARLAAAFGLPYAFASHFAPAMLDSAMGLYRNDFQPSKYMGQPYAMAALNVIAADTNEEARQLFTSTQQSFVNLRRGQPGKLPAPISDIESYWTPVEKTGVEKTLGCSVVGNAET